jgi:prepilin-type N-terminal cleavage/methylation domain-containing protein
VEDAPVGEKGVKLISPNIRYPKERQPHERFPVRCPIFGAKRMAENRRGFSLIELVAVVSVLSITAALVAPPVKGHLTQSRIDEIEDALETVSGGVAAFYADFGLYPPDSGTDPFECDHHFAPALFSAEQLPEDLRDRWAGPYLNDRPRFSSATTSCAYGVGRHLPFDFDSVTGNEVFLTVRCDLGRDALCRIDADLDDGIACTGKVRHDGAARLLFYVGEGIACRTPQSD